MYSGLLIILLPLFLGYLIPIKNKNVLHRVHQSLNSMVYVILFLMGITLALLENLSAHLVSILIYALTFFACIFGFNVLSLILLDKLDPWKVPQHKQEKPLHVSKWYLNPYNCVVFYSLAFGGINRV